MVFVRVCVSLIVYASPCGYHAVFVNTSCLFIALDSKVSNACILYDENSLSSFVCTRNQIIIADCRSLFACEYESYFSANASTNKTNANGNLHNRLIFKLTFLNRLRLIVIGDNAESNGNDDGKNQQQKQR